MKPEILFASGWLPVRLTPGPHGPLPFGGEWTCGAYEFTRRLRAGTARYAR